MFQQYNCTVLKCCQSHLNLQKKKEKNADRQDQGTFMRTVKI